MRKKKYVIGIGVIVLGLVSLLYAGTKSSMISYLNVREIKTSPLVRAGRIVQITGIVLPGSIREDNVTDAVTFELRDKDSAEVAVPVTYSGILPDEFKPGLAVVVQGTVENRKAITANRILTKCASKYITKVTRGGAAS